MTERTEAMGGFADAIRHAIRDVPDFPSPGIVFKDITPLLADCALFGASVRAMAESFPEGAITHVVAIESRGFILGAPIAITLGASFVPARKAGKLPSECEREEYALEYGTGVLELHRDALGPGARVLVVDDVLATGGTASAACRLVERLGGLVVGCSFLIELSFLPGAAVLAPRAHRSIVVY